MIVRPAIFPMLLPNLTREPMTSANVRALNSLLHVSHPSAFDKKFMSLLESLVGKLASDDEDSEVVSDTLRVLITKVSDNESRDKMLSYA